MLTAKYGKIVAAFCTECFDEAIREAWDAGPPEWLGRYEDGDFCIHGGPECDAWHEQHYRQQPCFVVECEYDDGTDELLSLCAKHLAAIAEAVRQQSK